MVLGALREAVDGLIEAGPAVLRDAATIEGLHRELARLEAVVTTATAAFDNANEWQADGARSASAWLAWRCRLPRHLARRRVRLGGKLRHLPACERAWLAGEITADHVAAIAAVHTDQTAPALARDEKLLVDNAAHLRFEHFARTVAYREQLADPDGVEDRHDRRHAQRDVYLTQSFQGMWLGKITLDPIAGAAVAAELARLEQALYDIDRAQARQRLGREPTHHDLTRTPRQRRADALLEMAARSAAAPPDSRRPAPLFSVLVGYETLHGRICELANGTPLTPGALLPWLDQAYIERAVFSPGRRVEVSATARLFTGATRRALDLRDRHCTHPTCDEPADRCQGDHIIPYTHSGPTTQDNGQLHCPYHNRRKNPRPPPDP